MSDYTEEMMEEFQPVIMNEKDLLSMERQLRQRMDNIQQYEDNCKAEIDRINEFYKDAIRTENKQVEFLQGQIQNFIDRQQEADPNYKPLKNPHVKITIRNTKDVIWDNEEEATLQVKATMPQFINTKVTETIDKAALKKAAKWDGGRLYNPDTGEEIAGISYQENKHYSFKVV